MSKPFFSGFLDYVPNYDLHPNEFDQELFHESLEFLTDALYTRGVVQPYVLTTTSRCSSIAQIIDDYIVSIRAISGETFMGAYTSIIQQLSEDRHRVEILLLRDTSLHERNNYSEFLLELWDNLLYTDSVLHIKALDCVSVVDKIGLPSFIERLRQMSKTEEGQFNRPPSIRKQYRVRSYTEQHQATPRQRKHKPNFNARESFLKMVDALKKVHQKV